MATSSSSSSSSCPLMFFMAVCLLIPTATSDISSDRAECADQLVTMATCLTYVQGSAKAPTPDCCTGLKQVLSKSPKCLCLLIKDHDDPGVGVKINVTLAFKLPEACSKPVNISACPKVLKLAPNSKDADVFKQIGSNDQVRINGTASLSVDAEKEKPESSGCTGWKKGGWVGLQEMVVAYCVFFLAMHGLAVFS